MITNQDRAKNMERTLKFWNEFIKTEGEEEQIIDVLTDLHHWLALRADGEFTVKQAVNLMNKSLRMARIHFGAEVDEEEREKEKEPKRKRETHLVNLNKKIKEIEEGRKRRMN